ncbi:hypothetical protein FOL47_008747, partial [Perkinsus chesapeaki]
VLEAVIGNVSIWEVSTWLDLLIFIDVLLDVMLFLIACIVVKWPSAPLFSRHIQDVLKTAAAAEVAEAGQAAREDNKITYSSSTTNDDDIPSEGGYDDILSIIDGDDDEVSDVNSSSNSTDTKSIEFVLEQNITSNCCLMIACHLSTMTDERYNTFTNTLRSAMNVFPPSHIFVCDNGPSLLPQDQTQWATQEVHPDINYLYTPEGNKTFAFYWCNKYWIPYLEANGRIPTFTYAVIIDDDVPLPSDLHIPQEQLMKDPTIKAVHFPITAASPDGNPNILVKCQDIEYKMAAVHKLFQAKMARCLSCHGAIALWDRETLDEIFYQHDTVFNGEDMYMGLSLLRKRDDSKIISCAQAIVPTYAPDSWMNLLVYSHERTNIKIGVREDEIRDIPPCPPHTDVDWFTVWVDNNNDKV